MLFLKILFLLLLYFDVRAQILPAEGYGTVIMYHRFDEDKYEDTSISSELFRSHLEFLNNEGYNVLPISKLVDFYTNAIFSGGGPGFLSSISLMASSRTSLISILTDFAVKDLLDIP